MPRSERSERMRARLREATIESIACDGIAGASVERITQRAGVSRGLVRHHFGSKNRLLAEAFQSLADDYRAMLGIGADGRLPGASAELRLRSALLPAFERLDGGVDRQRAWFGFWALARSDCEIRRIAHMLYEDVVCHLGDLIGAVAYANGRVVDAATAGRGLAAMIEGLWVCSVVGLEGTRPTRPNACASITSRDFSPWSRWIHRRRGLRAMWSLTPIRAGTRASLSAASPLWRSSLPE